MCFLVVPPLLSQAPTPRAATARHITKSLDNLKHLHGMLRLCYARKNRYLRRSHISEAKVRTIIRYFAPDLPASKIAEPSGAARRLISYSRSYESGSGIAQVCNASSPLSGEVEVEESYFGARRVRGKRVAERALKRSSSESWNGNATGKLHGNRP